MNSIGFAEQPPDDDAARPNILWITVEDMSPTLGCYGDDYADTPNIDAFAKESVKYTHAFATAPVCSPSRNTLITGCYATSLYTHQMRSTFWIPREIVGFPSYLKEAGYFTTNNVKTDYNTANAGLIIESSWDENSTEAHWRNRPGADQPFFSIFNLMTTHQSRTMVWPFEQFQSEIQSQLDPEEIHSPNDVPLPPYYPDTPVVRKTVARFYDCVSVMDQQVGEILKELEDDGLSDETIVFFYSDHGSGMPRHKRVLLDSGIRVPLLIRFPEKYQHLAPARPGQATDQIVSFVDFGPTVLRLAGIDPPKYMQGLAFLGDDAAKPRDAAFGHRDRIDEVYDASRSVRTKQYLYVRNYMPHLGWNQYSNWADDGEINNEFYRLANRERMTDVQWQFARPNRPVEELYDCNSDPLNLKNLADSSEHQQVLKSMRTRLRNHMLSSHDIGLIPEPIAWKYSQFGPVQETTETDWLAMLRAADHVGTADEATLLRHLRFEQPHVEYLGASLQYWGAVGLSGLPELSPDAIRVLKQTMKQSHSNAVIAQIAYALVSHGETEDAIDELISLIKYESNLVDLLYAARTIELLGEKARSAQEAMEELRTKATKIRAETPSDVSSARKELAWFIVFSTNGFLSRLEASGEPDFR